MRNIKLLFSFTVFFVLLAVTCICIGQPLDVSVKEADPVVVKTFPESGAIDVDPSVSEIRVTFNKEMMDLSWSWVQIAPENFPELIGTPRYLEDKRTCVVNVKLEPGTTYIIWLNTLKFRNFKDKDGNPAVPYLLMFETRK